MSSRQRRSTPSIDLGNSSSSTPGLLVGRAEFNEMKDTMRSILKRLDILEQVFVFVDIDQINQVLKKFSANLNDKGGLDIGSGIGHWEAMSAAWEKERSKSPTESGGSDSRTQSCEGQRIHEARELLANHASSNPLDVQGPRNVIKEDLHHGLHDPPWEAVSPPQELSPNRPPKRLPPLSTPETPSELRYREWDGLSTATDEVDRKSTCSTWDLCSTRSGWNEESEAVDPDMFKKFMNQALRPKWESRPQEDVVLVQNIEEDGSTQESTTSAAYWSQLMSNSKPQSSDP